MIMFSELQSYLLYYGAILLATIFAGLAQYLVTFNNGNRVVHPFFWALSFFCLFLPAAFRGYGVDHDSYTMIFDSVGQRGWSFLEEYSGFPEPLFIVVNFIADYLGDFQYVYIISAFISLFFTYKAFARKVNETNLAICVWMFSTLFYITLFGLVRIGIAVGIITYAIRYIEEGKIMKYSAYVIMATLFHYSAIVMLPLFFIFKGNFSDVSRIKSIKKAWLSVFILIGIFVAASYIMKWFEGVSWIVRYSGYFEGTTMSSINNMAGQYPLIVLLLVFGRDIKRQTKYGSLYISMFIAMMTFVIGSIFVSFTRLAYFLYPATYYLYSYVDGTLKNESLKMLYAMVLFVLMTAWFLYGFSSDLWRPLLIPYYLFF